MADEAATMSSSRIIKSDADSHEISDFSFGDIARGIKPVQAPKPVSGGGFVPLGIFDLSEVGAKCGIAPRAEVSDLPEEPPGCFVSDEELQRTQDEAYQRGLQDGKSLAERGLLHVFKSLRTAAEDLQMLREKVLRDSEDHLLAMTMLIAKQVILREVQQDRQTVVRLIHAAVSNLNAQDDLVIRVNPDDHALLLSGSDAQLRKEMAAVKFELKPDPTVTIGGCLVETRLGTVDAGLEAQLEEIYRSLLEEQTHRSSGTDEE